MATIKKATNTSKVATFANWLLCDDIVRAFELQEGRQVSEAFRELSPPELKASFLLKTQGNLDLFDALGCVDSFIGAASVPPNLGDKDLSEQRNDEHERISELSLKRPPVFKQRNIAAANNFPEETGKLDGLRIKTDRLIRVPLIDKFDRSVFDDEVVSLAEHAKSLWPFANRSEPRFYLSLRELGFTICEKMPYFQKVLEKLSTSYGKYGDFIMTDLDGSPSDFISIVFQQVGWIALQRGWAICIAEDKLFVEERLLTRVSPENFRPLSEDSRILFPSDFDLQASGGLDVRASELICADRLWFALSNDLRISYSSSRVSGGPRSRNDIISASEAEKIIRKLHENNPGVRMLKSDACAALIQAGFSQRIAERIWANAAPAEWKSAGRPPSGSKHISKDELFSALQEWKSTVRIK